MHTTIIGAWNGVEEVQQECSCQRGGTKRIRFKSPRWRPKAIQVQALFGVQEQCAIKWKPRSHTKSNLDVLYIVGRTISDSFQCHWSHAKIRPKSTGIVETKLTSRICEGAAPIPFGLLAQQEAHVGLWYCSHT
jgi:hypothetical protein